VLGPWRDLHGAVGSAGLTDYIVLSFGPFCAWCHFPASPSRTFVTAADGRKAMLRSFLERQSRVRRQDRDDPSAAPVYVPIG
jgi:hypothetical protein